MGQHFKTAAGLLLLVQAFHLATFQHSTNSTAITIDKAWLREQARNKSVSPNDALPGDELEYDERGQPPIESSSSGIPSGAMAIFPGEEDNLTAEGSGEEGTMFTARPIDVTFTASEPPDGNMSSTNNVGDGASESSQANNTDTTEAPDNQTATPRNDSSDSSVWNVTSAGDTGNHTDGTTASPQQEDITDNGTTTAAKDWNSTGAMVPDTREATTVGSATTVDQTDTVAATPTTSPEASTAVDLNTPEGGNNTGKAVADGSSSDRGMTAPGCTLSDSRIDDLMCDQF